MLTISRKVDECKPLVGGGGIRSNLHTAESLDATSEAWTPAAIRGAAAADASSSWRAAGRVEEARHALSACSTGDWGVYAIGGWANGNVSTGAVDFLDLRGAAESWGETSQWREGGASGAGGEGGADGEGGAGAVGGMGGEERDAR
jgi:hypothetical protein